MNYVKPTNQYFVGCWVGVLRHDKGFFIYLVLGDGKAQGLRMITNLVAHGGKLATIKCCYLKLGGEFVINKAMDAFICRLRDVMRYIVSDVRRMKN